MSETGLEPRVFLAWCYEVVPGQTALLTKAEVERRGLPYAEAALRLLDEVRRDGFAGGLEEAARIVAAHCCVSTCCDAQPGAGEAAALAACVRKRADR